jgi:hypothetical protein
MKVEMPEVVGPGTGSDVDDRVGVTKARVTIFAIRESAR